MTPPQRKPWFCDSTGAGREFTFPETGDEMGWLVDRLVRSARTFPHWRLDNDDKPNPDVWLTVQDHVEYTSARIGFACDGVQGTIALRPDPDTGFVLVVAEIGGVEKFRAYMDHPWEECDLFPPGDTTPQREDAPGHMSKNLWWISLSVVAWPVLAPLTTRNWFNAQVPDR